MSIKIPTRIQVYCFVLYIAIFFPIFKKSLGNLGAVLINSVLILIVGCIFLRSIVKGFKIERVSNLFIFQCICFVFLFGHILFAINIGAEFSGIDVLNRDYFELHRPVLYFLVFWLGYHSIKSNDDFNKYNKALIYIFVGMAFLSYIQFFKLLPEFLALYTKKENIKSARVSTPFLNPYDNAFIVSFFVIYFFTNLVIRSYWYIFPFVLSLLMLVVPQSRSVIAGFLIVFCCFVPLFYLTIGFDLKKITIRVFLIKYLFYCFAGVVVLILAYPLLKSEFSYLTGQFERFLQDGDIGNSANIRYGQFNFALEKALSHPMVLFFGNGPAKGELEYVESIINYQFFRYGIVGLILYLFFPLSMVLFAFRKLIKVIDIKDQKFPLLASLFLWVVMILPMSIGNNFTEQIRISFFYYSMLGIVFKMYKLNYLDRL